MYFTRIDDTFRGWFGVTDSDGNLRTNILSSSFDVNIIDTNDTTSSNLEVTQSVQKPGLYRFDIPSTFLSASGIGEYAISIEVDESSPPAVTEASSHILRITQEDFDTIAPSITGSIGGSIAGAVWDELNNNHLLSGSTGKQLRDIADRLREIYQIMGLELGSPLTVATISRTVAAISQSISGDPEASVTVTRL